MQAAPFRVARAVDPPAKLALLERLLGVMDVAECIDYLAEDPETTVICAAIESCKDGKRLRLALLKAAQAGKPVLIMKAGRTEVGASAAATRASRASHAHATQRHHDFCARI